jgi:hypothetical protein
MQSIYIFEQHTVYDHVAVFRNIYALQYINSLMLWYLIVVHTSSILFVTRECVSQIGPLQLLW